jgi:hypothetical protein
MSAKYPGPDKDDYKVLTLREVKICLSQNRVPCHKNKKLTKN